MLAGALELIIKHRSGSLDAAIDSLRRRNLAVSFGILLLLTSSVVMAVISSFTTLFVALLPGRVPSTAAMPLAVAATPPTR